MRKPEPIESISARFGVVLGTSPAIVLAAALFITWALLVAPHEAFNEPRLFVVEFTGMFIFLHLFLVQRVHNKDIKALHLKLDEIIATLDGANNNLIKSERAPEKEVDELHDAYQRLANNIPHDTKQISIESEVSDTRKRSA